MKDLSAVIVVLVGVAFILGIALVLYLEERYYQRHPEKERPEPWLYP